MHNIFMIAQREYVERVRSRSFLIMTVLVPVLMAAVTVGPSLLAVKLLNQGSKHFVVVASRPSVGEAIKLQLSESQERETKKAAEAKEKSLQRGEALPPSKMITDVDTNTSDLERGRLTEKVRKRELDGVIVATDDALATHKLTYITRDVSSFIQTAIVEQGVGEALRRETLKAKGLSQSEIDDVFKRTELEPQNAEAGGPAAANPQITFFGSFFMVMILYMSLLLYGINVMRSVLEEKTSRIMEVLLSVAQPKEMMAGKILGVGSVGLTQLAIWALTASGIAASGLGVAGVPITSILSAKMLVAFVGFFLLGYALYSTLYAAIGAMVNSEQEAQQIQFLVLIPIIAAIALAFPVMQNPGSQIAIWTSMFPLTAPIIMFIRIAVQAPTWWEIAISVALTLATTYGLILLCGRIYRVGILMYGKKPTLPEIMKWIRYA
ncbi:MAG TPA: ABC transporter permease [Candidatus Angelobacter sp.]|nr:ABC transporter permease [Candidatus Angelobacter sp.]